MKVRRPSNLRPDSWRCGRSAGLAPLLIGVGVFAACLSLATAEEPSEADAGEAAGATSAAASGSPDKRERYRAGDPAERFPQVALINKYIRQGWTDEEITPSRPATEGEWCRRIYLDVLGCIPSVEELEEFEKSRAPDKRMRLVDDLLGAKYLDEYTRNATTLWTNLLIGRSGGNENNTLTNRAGMRQYLRETFRENKPYDRMVHEIVSARGVNKPGEENFNGAVNFLTMKLAEDGVLATSRTSELFMGIRVQCTQCHDHPFNSWKQDQFWKMNAFFRQAVALRRFGGGQNVQFVELANQDFGGEGNTPEEAEIYYEPRDRILRVAYPEFTDYDGTVHEIERSGYISDVDRRQELAKLIVKSGYLPRAMVNRVWAHYLGYGFTKPINDMGPHNPPSHPELLDQLAAAFRESGYDIKQLTRWIVLSEPYSLSSKFGDGNRQDDPTMGETPLFSRFYLRQMRAEELYESLLVATEAHKTRGSAEEQQKAKEMWLQQFVIAFGTDENDETTTFDGTIAQTLMMFNGDLIKQATSTEEGSFLYRVATNPRLRGTKKINYLYKAALARTPTSRERRLMTKVLGSRPGQTDAIRDVWWVLLNTNEFILNH